MIMRSPDRSDSQFSCNVSPEVLMCTKGITSTPGVSSYQRLDTVLHDCVMGHSSSAFLMFEDQFCI